MKNQTMWIVGGVVLVGVGYYLWSSKKAAAATLPAGQGQAQVPPGQPMAQLPQGAPAAPAGFQWPSLPSFQWPSFGGTPAPQAPAPQAPSPPSGVLNLPTTPVTLTQGVDAIDYGSAPGTIPPMYRSFTPGQKVLVYGQPTLGVTSFGDPSEAPPHLYTTTQTVAGICC
jgi:hypothetical protein